MVFIYLLAEISGMSFDLNVNRCVIFWVSLNWFLENFL